MKMSLKAMQQDSFSIALAGDTINVQSSVRLSVALHAAAWLEWIAAPCAGSDSVVTRTLRAFSRFG